MNKYKDKVNKLIEHLQIVDKGIEDCTQFESELYSMGFDKGARLMLAYLMKNGFVNENNIEYIWSL